MEGKWITLILVAIFALLAIRWTVRAYIRRRERIYPANVFLASAMPSLISPETREMALSNSRGTCCYCRKSQDVEIYIMSINSNNMLDLFGLEAIVLCPECVKEIDSGSISLADLKTLKAHWIALH